MMQVAKQNDGTTCIIRLEIVGGNCEKFTKIEKDLIEKLTPPFSQ